MRAIIIGCKFHPQHIGSIVDAYPYMECELFGKTTMLYKTVPVKFATNGNAILYTEKYLVFLPPEDECEDPDAVLITINSGRNDEIRKDEA